MKEKGFIILLILLIACCKEKLPTSDDPIVGKWEITSVDSIESRYPWNRDKHTNFGPLNYTGSIMFNNDSTGIFEGSITAITGGQKHFLWMQDTTIPIYRMELFFINGETSAYADSLYSDTANIFINDYYFKPGVYGPAYYYYIKIVKTD